MMKTNGYIGNSWQLATFSILSNWQHWQLPIPIQNATFHNYREKINLENFN